MSSHLLRRLTFAAGTLCALTPSAAHADPVLDQVSTPIEYQAFACCGSEWGQTFTAGLAGTLATVQVYLGAGYGGFSGVGPLTYDVRRTVTGAPSSESRDVLRTGALSPSVFRGEGFYTLDFDPMPLSLGDQLEIVLSNMDPDSSSPWTWRFSGPSASTYDRGAMFMRAGTAAEWSSQVFEGRDFAFRTFVEPDAAPVPEPASWMTLAAGLLGAALKARRRP